MLSVPHLDREFDYLVSSEQSDDAQPGVRVRVRFHGRLVDAFILERRSDTDHVGKLGWLDRVVSAEPVLTPDVRRLADAVAARYAGTRADVLRLAVPPRHANVEKQTPPSCHRSRPHAVDATAVGGIWPRRAVPCRAGRGARRARGMAGAAGGALDRPPRGSGRGDGELRARRPGHRAGPARRRRDARRSHRATSRSPGSWPCRRGSAPHSATAGGWPCCAAAPGSSSAPAVRCSRPSRISAW